MVDDVDEMHGGVDEGVGESLQVSSIDIIFVIGCECGRIEDDRRSIIQRNRIVWTVGNVTKEKKI